MLDDFLVSRGYLRIFNANNMGTISIGNGEYLPQGMLFQEALGFMDVETSENVRLDYYDKEDLVVELYAENTSSENGHIIVPLLAYPGYVAKEEESGKILQIERTENGLVDIVLPEMFYGGVTLEYAVPWYWRMSEIISILSVFFIGAWAFGWRKNVI